MQESRRRSAKTYSPSAVPLKSHAHTPSRFGVLLRPHAQSSDVTGLQGVLLVAACSLHWALSHKTSMQQGGFVKEGSSEKGGVSGYKYFDL
eukprot:2093451-Amphidinium_carterae.2